MVHYMKIKIEIKNYCPLITLMYLHPSSAQSADPLISSLSVIASEAARCSSLTVPYYFARTVTVPV
jgi:hypothetical protein